MPQQLESRIKKKREPQSPQNRINSTKEMFEQFEGTTLQKKGFEANRSRKFTERSAKSLLHKNWGRGSGGVKSTGVSQSVRETGRDASQCVLSPEKLFKTRDLELPWGNPNGGLANGGLAQKAPIGPKKALSGAFSLPPRGCEVWRNWSQSAPKRPR